MACSLLEGGSADALQGVLDVDAHVVRGAAGAVGRRQPEVVGGRPLAGAQIELQRRRKGRRNRLARAYAQRRARQPSALVQFELELPALAVTGGRRVEVGLRGASGGELPLQPPNQHRSGLTLGDELSLDDVELGADADAGLTAGQPRTSGRVGSAIFRLSPASRQPPVRSIRWPSSGPPLTIASFRCAGANTGFGSFPSLLTAKSRSRRRMSRERA